MGSINTVIVLSAHTLAVKEGNQQQGKQQTTSNMLSFVSYSVCNKQIQTIFLTGGRTLLGSLSTSHRSLHGHRTDSSRSCPLAQTELHLQQHSTS